MFGRTPQLSSALHSLFGEKKSVAHCLIRVGRENVCGDRDKKHKDFFAFSVDRGSQFSPQKGEEEERDALQIAFRLHYLRRLRPRLQRAAETN